MQTKPQASGFDLYMTEDGAHFVKIVDHGFGDSYSRGYHAPCATDTEIVRERANSFCGADVEAGRTRGIGASTIEFMNVRRTPRRS